MKSKLASLTRHSLTWFAGLTAAIMTLPFLLPEDAAEVAKHVDGIRVGLVGLATVLATRALPWVLFKVGDGISKLLGATPDGEKSSKGSSGGAGSLLVMATAAGVSLAGFLLLPSCSAAAAALHGGPIPTTAVQRAGQAQAPVVQVASADLARAEYETERALAVGEPPPVMGLYDAGRAAEVAREVFTGSSK